MIRLIQKIKKFDLNLNWELLKEQGSTPVKSEIILIEEKKCIY
jgi:hypothetical protein